MTLSSHSIIHNTVPLKGSSISIASFCPFERASDLLVYGTLSELVIMEINGDDTIQMRKRNVLSIGSRMTSICWCPQTVSNGDQLHARLIGVTEDNSIYLIENDHSEKIDLIQPLPHGINCIAVDPQMGQIVAVGGDDKKLRLFSLETPEEFQDLDVQGRIVSLEFHPKLAHHILIAEATGTVSVFDIHTQSMVQRIFKSSIGSPYGNEGLFSADWSIHDWQNVGITVGDSWFVYNFGNIPSHIPLHSGDTYAHDKVIFRWSKSHSKMFALYSTLSGLKIHSSVFNRVPTLIPPFSSRVVSLSWHARRPLLLVSTATELALVKM